MNFSLHAKAMEYHCLKQFLAHFIGKLTKKERKEIAAPNSKTKWNATNARKKKEELDFECKFCSSSSITKQKRTVQFQNDSFEPKSFDQYSSTLPKRNKFAPKSFSKTFSDCYHCCFNLRSDHGESFDVHVWDSCWCVFGAGVPLASGSNVVFEGCRPREERRKGVEKTWVRM
jgi:hypothetical protein